jgi:plastocyanin
VSYSEFSNLSTGKLLIVAAAIAIVSGATVGVGVGSVIHYSAPTTREFLLFDGSLPFNDAQPPEGFGYPHDIFVPDRITVNKGDTVLIHYVNIEDVGELHNFHMDAPYSFDATVYYNATEHGLGGGVKTPLTHENIVVLGQGENATITFTASWAGVFPYKCDFHQPTMTGYLVVIG